MHKIAMSKNTALHLKCILHSEFYDYFTLFTEGSLAHVPKHCSPLGPSLMQLKGTYSNLNQIVHVSFNSPKRTTSL